MTPVRPSEAHRSAEPTRAQRVTAALALITLAAAAVYLVISAVQRWEVLVASLVTFSVTVVAAWFVVSRRGVPRVIAICVAIAALAGFVVVALTNQSLRVLLVAVVLGAVAVTCARYALSSPAATADVTPAPRPRHPVLIMNPKSGGGKAVQFRLADRCRELGIEPIVLSPGDDLLALAEDAAARGADVLGMAGGDGSQALVASVAARRGIPFVVVPAGTRNHFALDLGLDRADVPGALAAYTDGVDAVIDLAEVNGRVFVNNAALGIYAQVVQSSDYRDAKVQTAASMLPDLIGPGAAPSEVHFTGPDGADSTLGQLLLISNNPYHLERLRGGATRERLDSGALGAVSITVRSAADAQKLTALELAGRVDRFEGWQSWSTPELTVRSPAPIEVGIDGEALTLEGPLRFVSRPAALTVRLPRVAATGGAVRRALPPMRTTIAALWRTAAGQGESR